MGGPPAQVDYFISYTNSDRAWAEWIAWQLKEAGASVVLQAWDMVPGLDFLHEMQKATTTAKRTLAVGGVPGVV
jgi:TIR domain